MYERAAVAFDVRICTTSAKAIECGVWLWVSGVRLSQGGFHGVGRPEA